MNELEQLKRFYAEEIRYVGNIQSNAVIDAFAQVPREKYLGPGPWKLLGPPMQYRETPDDDPRHLYHNILVGLIPDKLLNNGQDFARI